MSNPTAIPRILAIWSALAASATAADVDVFPGQSIQGAIVAASSGDRILVHAGRYPETIDTLGKHVEIIGVDGASATTLDASGLGGSAVTLRGIFSAPKISGLTITGGKGSAHPDGTFGGGGIIDLDGTGAVIRSCFVAGNHVASGGSGGGVLGRILGVLGSRPKISECVIASNGADDAGGGAAGALELTRCIVRDNAAARGGGVFRVQMTSCWIRGNSAAIGGGVYGDCKLCRIEANRATQAGGGLATSNASVAAGIETTQCIFLGNSAPVGGGAFLDSTGAIIPNVKLNRCVFAGNTATSNSDGARLQGISNGGAVYGCTFVGDRLVLALDQATLVQECIFRQATPAVIDENFPLSITYSDVQGGAAGAKNFDADPQFVDAAALDFHLRATSPCIGKGASAGGSDFEGDDAVGVRDVGADEFAPHLAFTGAFVPGSPLTLGAYAQPGAASNLLLVSTSLAPAPVLLGLGYFRLGVPLLLPVPIELGPMPANGANVIPLTLPASAPPGLAIHAQVYFGALGWSNVASLVVD